MKSKSKQRISNQAFSDGYDKINWRSKMAKKPKPKPKPTGKPKGSY